MCRLTVSVNESRSKKIKVDTVTIYLTVPTQTCLSSRIVYWNLSHYRFDHWKLVEENELQTWCVYELYDTLEKKGSAKR